jgi:hypothetical protein
MEKPLDNTINNIRQLQALCWSCQHRDKELMNILTKDYIELHRKILRNMFPEIREKIIAELLQEDAKDLADKTCMLWEERVEVILDRERTKESAAQINMFILSEKLPPPTKTIVKESSDINVNKAPSNIVLENDVKKSASKALNDRKLSIKLAGHFITTEMLVLFVTAVTAEMKLLSNDAKVPWRSFYYRHKKTLFEIEPFKGKVSKYNDIVGLGRKIYYIVELKQKKIKDNVTIMKVFQQLEAEEIIEMILKNR